MLFFDTILSRRFRGNFSGLLANPDYQTTFPKSSILSAPRGNPDELQSANSLAQTLKTCVVLLLNPISFRAVKSTGCALLSLHSLTVVAKKLKVFGVLRFSVFGVYCNGQKESV